MSHSFLQLSDSEQRHRERLKHKEQQKRLSCIGNYYVYFCWPFVCCLLVHVQENQTSHRYHQGN